ncbi:putative porin [Cellvibrio fontiphilus]|uniref:Porin n=1 Tax=Cellvibrio fontiphilus TaxID=1815559 RepID=A0ABV7FMS7_9GAMM
MKMKLLSSIVAAVGLVGAPLALAANYQAEVSAAYEDIDYADSNGEGKFIGLEGKYYFAPVNTSEHPLAEAAFIEKASNVYLQLGTEEYKFGGEKSDLYGRVIGADFYIPNTIFFLGAGVAEVKSKAPASLGQSYDWESAWFVKAGVAPIEGLLVWSEFTEDIDVNDEWNINGKYVLPLRGEQALNLEASYEKSKLGWADDTITMSADYYIDRHLSLGAGFVNTSYDSSVADNADTDYFVRARNFFTDKASLELSYVDGEFENSLLVGGTIRF